MVFRLLAAQEDLVVCHELHYLQMVCEKLAKAYRLLDTKAAVDELVSKHTGFATFVGAFFLGALKDEYLERTRSSRASSLAREIEKLAPAIDRADAPENAEYPWQRDGKIVAPCTYEFPSLELLRQPGGRAFLNLIDRALADFERLAII